MLSNGFIFINGLHAKNDTSKIRLSELQTNANVSAGKYCDVDYIQWIQC